MKASKPKTLKRVLKEQTENFGGEMGLPTWVIGIAEDAYAEGKKAGVAQENRRLRKRLDEVTGDVFA